MRKALKWPLILCLVLFWFNTGIEQFRRGDLGDIPQHPLHLFTPPWLPLRAYVSREGDEHLYYEYSKLMLGEEPDMGYLAAKRQGDVNKNLAELTSQTRPGPGLRLPYRDFPFEYPPVSLGMFLLPRLVAHELGDYRVAFGAVAALCALIACAFGAGLRAPGDSTYWKRAALFILAMGPLLVARFDILPAMLTAAAMLMLVRKRSFAAGFLMGVGILTKLYPLFLLLPWTGVLYSRGDRRGIVELFTGTVAGIVTICVPFYLVSRDSFLKAIALYGERPLQIESLVGAVIALVGGRNVIIGSFGSINVLAPASLSHIWGLLLPFSMLACAAAAAFQPSERESDLTERLVSWTCATLALMFVTTRVLSPQFLIWLIPFIVLSPNVRARRWAGAAFILTQIYFPFIYGFLIDDGNRWVALLVVVRNVCLLGFAYEALKTALTQVAPESEFGTRRVTCFPGVTVKNS